MPLKLSVGLNKKLGQPNFGSVGASCSVEIELDFHAIARNPDLLQQQAQQAFAACAQAVAGELARQQSTSGHASIGHPPGGNGSAVGSSNGHTTNGHHQNGHGKPNGRQATASQVKAIVAIAGRHRLDLARELQSRFHVDRPENLSISDASRLIDELKTGSPQPGGP